MVPTPERHESRTRDKTGQRAPFRERHDGVILVTIASLTYVVAWFLPAVGGGTTLAGGALPGWEAFRASLSPLWQRVPVDRLGFATISVLSGLTNGWFLFSIAALTVWPVLARRALFWGLLLAALVNAQWFVLSGSDRAHLRIGYYLWLASFLLLAGATSRARSAPADLPERAPSP
jgi:hypothetical protein